MTAAVRAFTAKIKVDGSPLDASTTLLISRITVDKTVDKPDRAVIEIWDPDFSLAKQSGFKIGASIDVLFATEQNTSGETVFAGEVTALEIDYGPAGSKAVIHAYDKRHRLQRGTRTKAFVQMSYSDVVRKIAQDVGIAVGQIDSTGTVLDQISQPNVNDWTFIKILAARTGHACTVSDGKLDFKKPEPPKSPSSKCTYEAGDDALHDLRIVASASEQVSKISTRGWDPNKKGSYVGKADATSDDATNALNPKKLSGDFDKSGLIVLDEINAGQGPADKFAKTVASSVGGHAVVVRATVSGNAALDVSQAVKLSGFGDELSGTFKLRSVTHTYEPGYDGFSTTFVVGDDPAEDLIGGGRGEPAIGVGAGLVPAIVSDINDPKKTGRVKLTFPWLDDSYVSDWSRVAHAGGGSKRGLFILPEVNDEVLVGFWAGDFSRPFVLGGLYNGEDKPPIKFSKAAVGGKVEQRAWVTRAGHKIVLIDKSGKESITVATADGKHEMVFDQAESKISVTSTGDVLIKSDGKTSIEAKGPVNVDAKGAVSVDSKADVSIKAVGVASIEGAQVKITGKGSVAIKSSGMVEVSGAMVKLG